MRNILILVGLGFLALGVAVAQELPELTGKVTLQNGQTYEGVIEVAEFGVKEGAGIGSDPSMSHGYMSVLVEGQEVKVPFGDIASAEAKWVPPGTEPGAKWRIETITITRKDGSQVVGTPHWMLFATTARVRQADGTIARAYAFSSASPDFDPGNLLVKVEIAPATGAGTELPSPTTEPTQPGGEPSPPTTTPEPTEPTTVPEQPAVASTAQPGTPIVGAPSRLILTLTCPKCGERLIIEVDVNVRTGASNVAP